MTSICFSTLFWVLPGRTYPTNPSQGDSMLRPHQHDLRGEIRGRPSRHVWLVCLSDYVYGDH